ncbi:Pyruvate decarboxylase 1 [Orbilia oligospora]|uniref:Pyruvate decarboxylase n=1 Tax=Orbilia oligospora TaxID=2813651 RepID=A0A6G1MEC9_ORBOL|nr:Pyruvate decarboxylase 1 [Orbilia oligospora]KAF3255828.1 Pyruvate decarboxylase 1 [Orbilia oligospora]
MDETTIVLYLFKRLHQLGIRSVHGVPGDYNLVALDNLGDAGLNWVGNCNELNAGYAADGYARIKGISALITTFGVGELSALAAVAGSYSERVPVVHIVGTPSTISQKQGALLHHTLGNGDFSVFANMSRNISSLLVNLNDPTTAARDIDRALRACYVSAQPIYIALPTDMVLRKIPADGLETPINMELPENDPEIERDVIENITKMVYAANNAIILVDACAIRHRVVDEVHDLIDKSQLPAFATPMSKGAIDETNPRFGGVYVGSVSRPDVKEAVECADLIISIGALKSDFNSGGFTYRTSTRNTIELHSDHTKIGYATYPGITMKSVLQKLLNSLDFHKIRHTDSAKSAPPTLKNEEAEKSDSQEITHSWFWPHIGNWLQENDVVITETGTANFGIIETRFPKGVTAISQVLWGSIGYSVGACQGAALAIKESDPSRRVILFVGDGSFQLTGNEVSTMIRHGLKPILVIINNEGYTIERMIHGEDAGYNDIQSWKHTKLLETFGAKEGEYLNHVVKTRKDVDNLFKKGNEFSKADKIQLVELFMPKLDAPRALKITGKMSEKLNAKTE